MESFVIGGAIATVAIAAKTLKEMSEGKTSSRGEDEDVFEYFERNRQKAKKEEWEEERRTMPYC